MGPTIIWALFSCKRNVNNVFKRITPYIAFLQLKTSVHQITYWINKKFKFIIRLRDGKFKGGYRLRDYFPKGLVTPQRSDKRSSPLYFVILKWPALWHLGVGKSKGWLCFLQCTWHFSKSRHDSATLVPFSRLSIW